MKKVSCIILVLLLAMVPIAASAGELPMILADQSEQPIVELRRFFVQFDWRSDDSVDTVRRIRPLFYLGHGMCRGKVEMNLAATEVVNHNNGNWLEIGVLECAISPDTKVSVGRAALAGLYSFVPPFMLRTIEHPKANTFTAFGYGVQVVHSRGSWSAMVDVSGNSDKQFDDDGNFDRVESSFRIGRKLGSVGSISFTSQLSEDITRLSLDWMSEASQKFYVWAAVYYDEAAFEELMGMAQVSYPFGRFMRPHVMWDHRPDGSEEWTVGTEILLRKEVRAIVDYEIETERALGRLQFRW